MTFIEKYRELFVYEIDCNRKMLQMIESVPKENRSDPGFNRALCIAAHLSACRENWLDNMHGDGSHQTEWFVEEYALGDLAPRYAAMEATWTSYLASLTDEDLAGEFRYREWDGSMFGFKREIQILQLMGHAHYHRGQIALLADQLGGEVVDTDYVFYAVPLPD